jgi:hypothetical protein
VCAFCNNPKSGEAHWSENLVKVTGIKGGETVSWGLIERER